MTEAKPGDKVKVHYTGRVPEGDVFDSSQERGPLEFTIGENKIIPGFENAVIGMAPGQKKTVTIESDKGYGPHREELVQEVELEQLPGDVDFKVGQQLQVTPPGETQPFVVQVTEITDSHVKLDGNHPLAGKDLQFEIELVEIAA